MVTRSTRPGSSIRVRCTALALLLALVVLAVPGMAVAQEALWAHQFGMPSDAHAFGAAVDDTGVYVVGTYPEQNNGGHSSAVFVRKHDVGGNELWTRQFATPANVMPWGTAAGHSGIYVAGETYGTFPGQAAAGMRDAFVRKYDANGNELWTRQFGTSSDDLANGVAVDDSGVYVVGVTYGAFSEQVKTGFVDAFVRKYDPDGNELWTRQFGVQALASGSGAIHAGSIVAGSGGLYVVGETNGILPGQQNSGGNDAFVRKYDADGNELWTRQFGTLWATLATGVAMDSSGVYVVGSTCGTFPGQTRVGPYDYDAFVRRYSTDGNELWTRQFGTSSDDLTRGAASTASGVYVVGNLEPLPGQTYVGDGNGRAFIRKLDAGGNELWSRQLGTPRSGSSYGAGEGANGVAVDDSGVYVAGWTQGSLPDQVKTGGNMAFVAKLTHSLLVDAVAPLVGELVVNPNPAPINTGVTVTARLDDSTTGGSSILSAAYSIDGQSPVSMTPVDGAFDDASEVVTATIPPISTAGVHEICVRGVDAAGNSSTPACILLAVYDPDGGFVTGGGWMEVARGAHRANPDLEGRATFGFVSKYSRGAATPSGNTEFHFRAGALGFSSSSYEWLVVNQSGSNAQYKGSGTINGQKASSGDPYRFMLWAGDGAPDTFRIRIWHEVSGVEEVVFDNGTQQPIGGGSIIIHR